MGPPRKASKVQSSEISIPSDPPVESSNVNANPLQFNQPLTWTAGKTISEGELEKRLTALYTEIRTKETEDVNLDSLKTIAANLVSDRLLKHKSKGVQAWAVLNWCEIVRVFAPNAPYTNKEFKFFFTILIHDIIPALSDSTSTYHQQHLKVIVSLQEIQSILLIQDAQGANTLIRDLFTTVFDVLSGPSKSDISANVSTTLEALLIEFVSEADDLPESTLDVILAQFLRADPKTLAGVSSKSAKKTVIDEKQATLLLKEAPAAYTVAQGICNSCPDKMARSIYRYFSPVLVDTSIALSNESKKFRKSDDDGNKIDEERLANHTKAHLLLRELWRAAPETLRELIPMFENELVVESDEIRAMAVKTIGDMVSGIGVAGFTPPSTLDPSAFPSQSTIPASSPPQNFLTTPSATIPFIIRYSSTFKDFLSRKQDKSPVIRSELALAIGKILQTDAGGLGMEEDSEDALLSAFSERLLDVDDKVRQSATQALASMSVHPLLRVLTKDGGLTSENSILFHLCERAKDKKPQVRNDAIELLGKVWGVAYGAMIDGFTELNERLSPIASKLYETLYIQNTDIYRAVERSVFDSLIPLSYPPKIKGEVDADSIRVRRILFLVNSLDGKSREVFFKRQSYQKSFSKYILVFIEACEAYNGGVIDTSSGKSEKEIKTKLDVLIQRISEQLPESQRSIEDLRRFAKHHDRRSYALIRFCCNSDSDWAKIRKSIKEVSKRLDEATAASSLPSTVQDTILTMLYRGSLLMFNRSNVPAIIHYSRSNEDGLGAVAHEIMREISKTHEDIFSIHLEQLCKTLTADAPTATKTHLPNAVQDLQACAEFSQKFPEKIPQDRKFFNALINYIKFGSERAVKFATRILLTTAAKKDMFCQTIFEHCASNFKYGKDGYLAKLVALSELAINGSTHLEQESRDKLSKIAIDDVLTNTLANPEVSSEDDNKDDWEDIPEHSVVAKRLAVKILVNQLRSHTSDIDLNEAAKPVLRFLNNILDTHGQTMPSIVCPKSHASRLRLVAANSLLKLSTENRFREMISPLFFNRLAITAQDETAQVRSGFIRKTLKYLSKQKLSSRFYTPLFLMAFEPDVTLKRTVETWLRTRASSRSVSAIRSDGSSGKDHSIELAITRLISLLAHHPDYDETAESLADMGRYIIFFLQAVATKNNISLIYYLAQRIKSFQDAINKSHTNRLYILSDLASALIRRWEDRHGWMMETWPLKLSLPAGIFQPLDKRADAHAIAAKLYLPAAASDEGQEGQEGQALALDLDRLVAEGVRAGKRAARRRLPPHAHSHAHARQSATARKRPRDSRDRDHAASRHAGKRAKKDPKVPEVPVGGRRRSGRSHKSVVYAEEDGEERNEERERVEEGEEEEEEEEEEEGKEDDKEDESDDREAVGRARANGSANGKGRRMKRRDPSSDVEMSDGVE